MHARKADADEWTKSWGEINPEKEEQVSEQAAQAWQSGVRGLFDAICHFSNKPPTEVWAEVRAEVESYTGEDRCMPDDIDWVGSILLREAEVDVIAGSRIANRYKGRHPLINALSTVLGRYQ